MTRPAPTNGTRRVAVQVPSLLRTNPAPPSLSVPSALVMSAFVPAEGNRSSSLHDEKKTVNSKAQSRAAESRLCHFFARWDA
ncbi:MAG: hypothetical protein H9789_11530, partial [Candidatus Paraprevotella stercoravium]|nr:hypothetical protein [Candidatus Paraprevotella stercoravium]